MSEFLKDVVDKRMNDQEVQDWSTTIHRLDIPRFTSDPWAELENENA